MQFEIPNCNFIDFLLLLTPRRRRYRVIGLSMSPLLQDGEEVIVNTSQQSRRSLQVDDIVVLCHPHQSDLILVKRIDAIALMPEKRYFVTGDNPAQSTDSRDFGSVSPKLIIGKVVCRFL